MRRSSIALVDKPPVAPDRSEPKAPTTGQTDARVKQKLGQPNHRPRRRSTAAPCQTQHQEPATLSQAIIASIETQSSHPTAAIATTRRGIGFALPMGSPRRDDSSS